MNLKSTRKLWGQQLNKNQAYTINPLLAFLWGVLENKTNANSHPNIASLKTAIEEGWNKLSE